MQFIHCIRVRCLSLQGFESYKGIVQSLRGMFQIGREVLQALCGYLQSYRGIFQAVRGELQCHWGILQSVGKFYPGFNPTLRMSSVRR